MDTLSLVSREAWIRASRFHDFDDDMVLSHVLLETRKCKDQGLDPWVVFDLDSTLYEVTHRTRKILTEALTHFESIPPLVRDKIQKGLSLSTLGYSVRDTLLLSGLSPQETEQFSLSLRNFWWDRFFTDDYLAHDLPYPGAVDYVCELYELGAGIAYLTGRDIPRMHRGTVQNLRRDGFPIDKARTSLLMKPQAEMADCEFKVTASETLSKQATIIASFENEPKNLIALRQALPETLHVFVATVCSDSPTVPGHDLFRISTFDRKR